MAKTVIASLKKNKKTFQIMLDFKKYIEWKEKKNIPLSDVIVGDSCFSNISKAECANESDLKKEFGTAKIEKIAEDILKKGHVQLTVDERKEIQAKKKKQIIYFICSESIDPQTNCPPTPTRVELALHDAHFNIDIFSNIDDEIKNAIKKIKPILPLIFQKDEIELKIPVKDAHAVGNIIRSRGKILKEKWTSNFWEIIVQIHAGKTTPLLKQLSIACRNEIIYKKKEN